MHYQEFKPPGSYSQHIECYWHLILDPEDLLGDTEMLSPDCTFEVLFCSHPFYYRKAGLIKWQKSSGPTLFVGQRTASFSYKTTRKIEIFGIRFKPFAFGTLSLNSLSIWNDQIVSLQTVFPYLYPDGNKIYDILATNCLEEKLDLVESLLRKIVPQDIDHSLRDQTNYILHRKGMVKIQEMYVAFSTNKLNLANNFIHKIGISPKHVCRIWRMNNFLFLQAQHPNKKFTQLCLEAGYYDQAHFIKEFRSFFMHSPRRFYQSEPQLLKITQEGIQKRFTRQYDPFDQEVSFF